MGRLDTLPILYCSMCNCSQKCLLKAPYIEKQSLPKLIKAYGNQLTCKDDGEVVFADELSWGVTWKAQKN